MTKEELLKLGEAVASHLGAEWKASLSEGDSWRPTVELKREDGAALTCWPILGGAQGRLNVSGEYPRPYNYSIERTKDITIALTRGPEVIARNIKARFLPDYLATYAQAVERKRALGEVEAARLKALGNLAAIIQESLDPDGALRFSHYWKDETSPEYPAYLWGNVYMSSSAISGKLRIENAPVALLAKLLQVFQEFRTKEPVRDDKISCQTT